MRWMDALVWMLVSTSILGLGHFYVYRRLVAGPGLPKPARIAAGTALLALLVLVPVTFVTMRTIPRDWITIPAFVVFGWMGLLSSWFTLLVLTDVGRWTAALVQRFRSGRPAPADETAGSRRRALSRLLASGVAIGGAVLTGVGVGVVAYGFAKKRLEITLDKLPTEFDGFKIVQVSDIHVGPTIGRGFVEAMVAAANEE